MINYINDNPVILNPTGTRNRKQKIYCVICHPRIELTLINESENRYKCDRCKNTYQPMFEIFPTEDELISSHEQNNEGPLLFSATDTDIDSTSKLDRENQSKTDKKLPKYLQDSDTTKLISYEER